MKRVKHVLILLCLCLYAGVSQAQVTIGDNSQPNTFSVLELVSNQERGLRLPQLTTAERDVLDFTGKAAEAKGLMIYNTTTNCVETWNGTDWISSCACEPTTSLTIKANTNWQQHRSGASFVFKAEADGSTDALAIDWYVNDNPVGTTTGNNFFFYNPEKFGRYIVQAKVRESCSAASTVASNLDTVIVGCGANTLPNNEWLVFMCHNLGADTSLDPFVYQSDGNAIDFDIKGYLYQWGRPSDGHQLRNSGTTATLSSSNIPEHANFITSTATPYDWRSGGNETSRWGDGSQDANPPKAANDPCPTGWKVPSQAQWGSIFRGGTASGAPGTATANTWKWGNGFMVGKALFLPAAGYRGYFDASLDAVGSGGYYWSSAVNGINSYYLNLNGGNVHPANNNGRGNGFPVRCVSE